MKRGFLPWLAVVLMLPCQLLQAREPLNASMIQLIANPNRYNGVRIRVVGYVKLAFEGNVIFPHKQDADHGMAKTDVWLEVDPKIWEHRGKYDGKYILVEGVFSSRDTGHMGMSVGAIKKIARFQVWSDPERPRYGNGSEPGAR